MLKIGIDAMGGDFAPEVAVEGAVMALKKIGKDSRIVLFTVALHKEADDLHQVVNVVVLSDRCPRYSCSTGVIPEIGRLFSHNILPYFSSGYNAFFACPNR